MFSRLRCIRVSGHYGAKWRLSGIDGGQYELQQNFGQISWRGTINVVDGEVASSTTIDLQPPFGSKPDIPSIDGLFERIANAIATKAATITVSWHPTLGYPVTCFIDRDKLALDDENGWSILLFTSAP